MKKILPLVLILILMVGCFVGCGGDEDDAPIIPSVDFMLIDFSNFISDSNSAVNGNEIKGVDDSNWGLATSIVKPWIDLISITFDTPVKAFKSTSGMNASQSGDKWEWSSIGSVKAKLIGETSGSQVKWELYVDDAKLMTGTSNTDGNSGQWIFSSQTNPLQIDWKKSGTKVETITYTSNGTSIKYGLSPASGFNFHYTLSSSEIEWNATKDGRIKINTGDWQCWGTSYQNIDCK